MADTISNAVNEEVLTPAVLSEQTAGSDIDSDKEKKPRAAVKDRSGNKYSEEDFRHMARSEQLKLARKYWMDSKGFDDSRMFQFSYTHFSDICKELGFIKGVIDTKDSSDDTLSPVLSDTDDKRTIYIHRGKRGETIEKKVTLNTSTNEKFNRLLDSEVHQLSNGERSKVLDAILDSSLDDLLSLKKQGKFHIAYPSQGEERLV